MEGRSYRACIGALNRHSLLIVAIALIFGMSAEAQFRLFLSRPILDEYPRIKIPLQVRDNASHIGNLQLGYFTVTENGVPRTPVYLDCLTDTVSEPVTFLFVMDVSNSMRFEFGTHEWDVDEKKWKAAKAAFMSAVNAMRTSDAGVLYSLSRLAFREWDYTNNKDSLKYAILNLDFRDGTNIYDAIVNVLLDAANAPGKVVMILLTDGSDQGSLFSVDEAIQRANQMTVPIFVIGLDVLVQDEVVLQRIGNETGGAYYYAPSAEQLQIVMNNISQSILSSNCILAYDTDDTCKDGRVRNVRVTATIAPYTSIDQTSYQLPYALEEIPLSVGDQGMEYADDMQHDIPLYIGGYLKASQTLKFSVDIAYDPLLLQFVALEPGGIGDIAAMTATFPATGVLRIEGNSVSLSEDVPKNQQKPLCLIRMNVLYQDKINASQFNVSNVVVSQDCPAVASGRQTVFSVAGCAEFVSIGLDSTIVMFPGKDIAVPIRMLSPIDMAQEMQFYLRVAYDTAFIRYRYFQTVETIAENVNVTVVETAPGLLEIRSEGGKPSARTGDMVRLFFSGVPMKQSHEVPFRIVDYAFAQSCTPVVQPVQLFVLLNGLCDKIVQRKDFYLYQNAPNPVSVSSGGQTFIPYRISGGGEVTLELYDLDGKPAGIIFSGYREKGEYLERFDTGGIAAGVYMIVLRENGNQMTRKMVLTK